MKSSAAPAPPRKPVSVLVVGVGGQGVLLASEVLGEVAAMAGMDVKKSEVHGMAQRGGSVVSHLRYGREVFSPLISLGEADYLLAFEKLEALRYLDYIHRDSWVFVNDQEIYPLPVSTGRAPYPGNVRKRLRDTGVRFKILDGVVLARESGNPKAVNAVLLGLLSKVLPFGEDMWEEALRMHVPTRHLAVNREAFRRGRRSRLPNVARGPGKP